MSGRGDERASPAAGGLPELLALVEGAAGTRVMLEFAGRYGGATIYLPKKFKADHPVAGLIGERAADALVSRYGYGDLSVPLGPTSAISRRTARILALLAEGRSKNEIARLVGCSRRTVQRLRNRAAA